MPTLPRVRETRAFAWAASGCRDQARRELAALEAERAHATSSAWEIARAYAVMADADNAAFRWLESAIDERAPMTLFAGVHPALDPIRGDPRFGGIRRRLGLPPTQGGGAVPGVVHAASGSQRRPLNGPPASVLVRTVESGQVTAPSR